MTRYIVLLLSFLLLLSLALEMGMRRTLPHFSQVARRIGTEGQAAIDMRRDAGQPEPILIVGNSLLADGVDPQVLDNSLRPAHRVVRFVLEDTNYLDWYYGLRKLFRDGARPQIVLVMLTARQFSTTGVRGDIFGRVLLDPVDILKVKHDIESDNTESSSLLFATLSQFYGFRSEVRKWALVHLVPGFPELAARLRPDSAPLSSDEVLARRIEPRLEQLAELCHSYGAELVVIVPPNNAERDGSSAIQQAAKITGTPVLIPIRPRELPLRFYQSDGFHLNTSGEAVFTQALAASLQNLLPPTLGQATSPQPVSQLITQTGNAAAR